MKRTLYLMSSGTLRRQGNTLVLEPPSGKEKAPHKHFPIEQIKEILIFGEIELNKRTLEFLTSHEVSVHFFNHFGNYIGTFYPREHYNSGYMLVKQVEHYLDEKKRVDLARRFVQGGLQNMLQVLRYYINRGKGELQAFYDYITRQALRVEDLEEIQQLMQAEGQAREAYYKAFDLILDNEDFAFDERTRRPPQNRLNALLSFGNSLLYALALSEIYKTHLDPRIGFLHASNFRRFSLNLDVAEIFKPILVDRLVLSLIQKEQIKAQDFESELGGLFLKEKAKHTFIEAWEKRLSTTLLHRGLGRNVSYRGLVRLELYKLEKHLLGEKEYIPFRSRW